MTVFELYVPRFIVRDTFSVLLNWRLEIGVYWGGSGLLESYSRVSLYPCDSNQRRGSVRSNFVPEVSS